MTPNRKINLRSTINSRNASEGGPLIFLCAIVDFIQAEAKGASGVGINAGAFTQVGYSILDALIDAGLPVVEVHLSNIHAREEFRRHSVIAPFAKGQIAGLGHRGYLYALDFLSSEG